MEENKILENEITEEVIEEVVEEVVETEEAIEEVVEDATQETEKAVEENVSKKGKAGVIVAIVVAFLIVVAAAVTSTMEFNKYNKLYVDTSGQTLEDVVAMSGMTLEEFLQQFDLPEDMPASTSVTAAEYFIPTGKIAELQGANFEMMKAMFGFGDDVTAETPWGEAEGKIRVGIYVGEENLESFKAEYGLGDDVTADTLWGEIRNDVAKKINEKRLEQEKEMEAAMESQDEAEVVMEEVPVDEVPVDEAPAEEAPAEEAVEGEEAAIEE